ncbi:hypothetical protein K469DRAFT_733284 [Zopfia rhizophila CBS 207.26]|uniref:Galactose oxidase n=1 Tax=Zopfia rhizophila CBS 207.26 TaxID=1314779 RepID=A0A6A6EIT3_9PEZI|nr:hypothetical protein K469DRAFT_733284 [Zopfia rhizophila CBS 207.26]
MRVALPQNDPLKNFCRLFGHQTTLIDRKMYIDGGLVNWAPLSAESVNYTSTWLKHGDLDDNNQGFPQQEKLAKNESTPSVHGGVLWADSANKIVYQYGGEFGNGKPEAFALWYYDIVYNTWNISNASRGAGVVAQDRATAFYYGGWLSNASVPGYGPQTPLSSMLVYDMLGSTFRNQSGPDAIPRAEGVMLYLPIGDSGFLVYFGGIEFPYGNSTREGTIFLYDIANDIWYKQNATGDVPEKRRRFCAGATWAGDRSSYNIYFFGGASIDEGVGFGDVYVLSLPSFKWIKFWPRTEDNAGATFPHHSLSCDVVENSQMIIMGGHFPNLTRDCDVPTIYGQHGLDLGKSNAKGAKWAEFNPKLTTYQVPVEIARTIGGGPTGGATVLAPTAGWGERDLSVQFERAYTPTTRAPTRHIPSETAPAPPPSTPPKSSNKKAIIGGAVGGALGGLLLVALIVGCLFLYRRKKNKSEKSPRPPSELPSQSIVDPKSPALSTQQASYHTPSVSQFTPQGSPPLHSDRHFSQYSAVPEYPGPPGAPNQTVYAAPQPSTHNRSPSEQSQHGYGHPLGSSPITHPSPHHSHQSPQSPTAAAQEMPIVRSPPGFHQQPQPQSLNAQVIDPYYANHPPSPPAVGGEKEAH